MLAVFRRELRAYFSSPIGFVFVGFFILIAGVFFAISNLLSGNPNFTGVLSSLTFVFLTLGIGQSLAISEVVLLFLLLGLVALPVQFGLFDLSGLDFRTGLVLALHHLNMSVPEVRHNSNGFTYGFSFNHFRGESLYASFLKFKNAQSGHHGVLWSSGGLF